MKKEIFWCYKSEHLAHKVFRESSGAPHLYPDIYTKLSLYKAVSLRALPSPMEHLHYLKCNKGISSEFILDAGPVFVVYGIGSAHFRKGLRC